MATAANENKPLGGHALQAAIEKFFNRRTVEGFSYSHEQVGGEDVYKLSLTSNAEKTVEAVIKGPQGFLDSQASLIPLFLEGVTVDRICVCEEGPFMGLAIHYINMSQQKKMFRLMVERSFVGKVFCEVFLREEMSTTA